VDSSLLNRCCCAVLTLALTLQLMLAIPSPVSADWICEGDRLSVETIDLGREAMGALADSIPNTAKGTVPGDGILIHWRGVTLQLPRTNNAGVPSYTDGRWWWRAEDPDHPEFRQRRGAIETYSCEPLA
jgi:hypothetical protein